MANRSFKEPKSYVRNLQLVAGSFQVGGTGAPASLRGLGFSAARTNTGLYTITLNDVYATGMIQSVQCTHQQSVDAIASNAKQILKVGAIDPAAKTIVLRLQDESGNLINPPTADANTRMNFVVLIKNSSVTPR